MSDLHKAQSAVQVQLKPSREKKGKKQRRKTRVSVVREYEQGNHFILRTDAKTTANTVKYLNKKQKNSGEVSEGKNEGEWTWKVEISSRKKSLAINEAGMATFWPTPGFKGRTFELWFLNWRDTNFCIRNSPLRGVLGGTGEK